MTPCADMGFFVERAESRLIEQLSHDLTSRFGRSFVVVMLTQIRRLYQLWAKRAILQTASEELGRTSCSTSLRGFPLASSHYVQLVSVDDPKAREFYEAKPCEAVGECANSDARLARNSTNERSSRATKWLIGLWFVSGGRVRYAARQGWMLGGNPHGHYGQRRGPHLCHPITHMTNLPTPADQPPDGQVLIYEDGGTRLKVRLDGRTVWLPQRLIADLFQVTVPTVNEHIGNIYDESELDPGATIRKFRIVQTEGGRQVARLVDHYSLDAILAVGFRVRSHVGTRFRQWAIARLGELLVKGFTLDDERIKDGRTLGDDYFEELLARVRDIRSSERMFYQKITDIYATSIDYDVSEQITQTFFKTIQNKMHWAAHGHTAAEIVKIRAQATEPHMGLTSWKNAPSGPVRKTDVTIAKNYLSHDEIESLNRIVSAYLEFAELQARNRRPMRMADWISKLDDFLKLSERDILTHAGKISHEAAQEHAHSEFAKHEIDKRGIEATQPTSDFDKAVARLQQPDNVSPKPKRTMRSKPKPPRSGEDA